MGNGDADNDRSNAHTLDWDGNAWFAGDVKAGDISLIELNNKIKDSTTNNNGSGVGMSSNNNGEIFNLYEDITYTYNNIPVSINTNLASGKYSHAEGIGTKASGDGSHAEGILTTAYGINSHAEGAGTYSLGVSSHAEGIGMTFECEAYRTEVVNDKQYLCIKGGINLNDISQLESIRKNNLIWIETDTSNHTGNYYIIQGEAEKLIDILSGVLVGYKIQLDKQLPSDWSVDSSNTKKVTIISGASCAIASHVEGKCCIAVDLDATTLDVTDETESYKQRQHAEGSHTLASGYASHAEGEYSVSKGSGSHAEGINNIAEGEASHAEGKNTTAFGDHSHAEGKNTTAFGGYSHAEGTQTIANESGSHAEGYGSQATAFAAHSEGQGSKATASSAHAEGNNTKATGDFSHSEGYYTETTAKCSHAEGNRTKALGEASHAEGDNTIASGIAQHAQGRFNIKDENNEFAHIVGNGTDKNNRSNAYTLDWDGNAWFAGGILLTAPNGTTYKLTINNEGQLTPEIFTEY